MGTAGPAQTRRAAAFGAAGVALLVVYYLVDGSAQNWVYDAFGAACAGALAYRARCSPSGQRAPWVLAASGVALWTAGDALSGLFSYGETGLASLLTAADVLYLLGYPVLAAAILQGHRVRGGTGDRGVALDGVVLLLAAALPMYEFWVRPALQTPDAGTLAIAVSMAYPVMDMLLLAAAIRLAVGTRGLNAAGLLLGAGLIGNVIADAVYNVAIINGGFSEPNPVDAGWLLGYVAWGAAALLPSSAALTQPGSRPAATQRRRAAMLMLLVASPLSVVAAAYREARELNEVAVIGTVLLISIVVSLRLRAQTPSERRGSAFLYAGAIVVVGLAMVITHLQGMSHERFTSVLDHSPEEVQRSALSTAAAERTLTVVLLIGGGLLLMWLARRFGASRREIERSEERSRALRDSERRMSALVAGSADILTLVDAEMRVLAHPETVERVLGIDGILGQRLDEFLDDTDASRTRALLARLGPGDADTIDWSLRRSDGSHLTAEARVANHRDDPLLGGFVLNVRDVTARADLERELEYRAYHDHLTGVANRARLEDRLRHALARSARTLGMHAIVVIDLDDFKSVNDTFGHAAGDALLIEAGQRLKACLRGNDTLARLGGDEFAILVEDVPSLEEALDAARRLLEALRAPFDVAGRALVVSGCAGMAVTDGGLVGTPEEAAARELRNADLAMHEAKRVGEGSVELFAPEMHEAVASRVELLTAIKKGIEREQFVVHYQPIVELADRGTVGYEALVRWRHPQRGLVSPLEFIPAAEQSGLIVELGGFVLREATRQLAEWNRDGGRRYVSVNIAGSQIQRDAIVTEVATALADSGLDPELLQLEVTETGLIRDSEGNERRMTELRELGLRLAIDDFGTGYSSLSYLQRFSMDVLKIDKSFVDAMDGGPAPLVEAMITMASALGLDVVAEGIETDAQLAALQALGCRRGQGYLFAPPLPPQEIEGEQAVVLA